MARNIILPKKVVAAQREGEPPPTVTPDNYASEIVKLIPVEIVGVYLGISNLIEGQGITNPTNLQWCVFFAILILTPFYLYRAAEVKDVRQIVVASVSFVVWALSLGGPFASSFNKLLTDNITIKFLGGNHSNDLQFNSSNTI